jgi:hypothetical protein
MIKRFIIIFILVFCGINNIAHAEYIVYLRAEAKNVTMPDGIVVPMWGFARDSSFEAHDGDVTIPGPIITVPSNENNLKIYLENNLPVPISLVIPGQQLEASGGPVRNSSNRIQSFSHETPPGNTSPIIYEWEDFKPGTYLLHSGTDPSIQVPMGLYCVIKKDSATGQAYSVNTSYDTDAVIVFSEIDPLQNQNVASNPGVGTISSINYSPKYLLVNGVPYYPGRSSIDIGNVGSTKLLRVVNAGLKDRVFTMIDARFKVIAEDGNEYPYYQDLFAVVLAAGQVKDILFTPTSPGYYPIFDRKLGLTNNTNTTGGHLAFLQVRSTNQYSLTVNKLGTGTGKIIMISKPGGIDCGNQCVSTYNEGTVVTLKAVPDSNSTFVGWSGACTGKGDCEVTLTSNQVVTASFAPLTKIILNEPNGGEILPTGTNYMIKWEAPTNLVNFSLFYSLNGGVTWLPIVKKITNKSYLWFVPAIKNNTKKARIKVVGFNSSNVLKGADISDAPFTIEVIKVTYPDLAGLTFTSGSPWQITWETNLTVSPVASTLIQYSTNGGLTWKTLATLSGNPGSYTGTVPTVTSATSKGLIRVVLKDSNNNSIGMDVSDNFFTINP